MHLLGGMCPLLNSLCQETREVQDPQTEPEAAGRQRDQFGRWCGTCCGRGLAAQSGWSLPEPDLAEVGGEQGGSRGAAGDPSQVGIREEWYRLEWGRGSAPPPRHILGLLGQGQAEPDAGAWTVVPPPQRLPPGPAQVIARSSGSPSIGRPWRPQWHPRHQRRTHQERQSHQAAHPGPRPARLDSSCPSQALPWWPPALCP